MMRNITEVKMDRKNHQLQANTPTTSSSQFTIKLIGDADDLTDIVNDLGSGFCFNKTSSPGKSQTEVKHNRPTVLPKKKLKMTEEVLPQRVILVVPKDLPPQFATNPNINNKSHNYSINTNNTSTNTSINNVKKIENKPVNAKLLKNTSNFPHKNHNNSEDDVNSDVKRALTEDAKSMLLSQLLSPDESESNNALEDTGFDTYEQHYKFPHLNLSNSQNTTDQKANNTNTNQGSSKLNDENEANRTLAPVNINKSHDSAIKKPRAVTRKRTLSISSLSSSISSQSFKMRKLRSGNIIIRSNKPKTARSKMIRRGRLSNSIKSDHIMTRRSTAIKNKALTNKKPTSSLGNQPSKVTSVNLPKPAPSTLHLPRSESQAFLLNGLDPLKKVKSPTKVGAHVIQSMPLNTPDIAPTAVLQFTNSTPVTKDKVLPYTPSIDAKVKQKLKTKLPRIIKKSALNQNNQSISRLSILNGTPTEANTQRDPGIIKFTNQGINKRLSNQHTSFDWSVENDCNQVSNQQQSLFSNFKNQTQCFVRNGKKYSFTIIKSNNLSSKASNTSNGKKDLLSENILHELISKSDINQILDSANISGLKMADGPKVFILPISSNSNLDLNEIKSTISSAAANFKTEKGRNVYYLPLAPNLDPGTNTSDQEKNLFLVPVMPQSPIDLDDFNANTTADLNTSDPENNVYYLPTSPNLTPVLNTSGQKKKIHFITQNSSPSNQLQQSPVKQKAGLNDYQQSPSKQIPDLEHCQLSPIKQVDDKYSSPIKSLLRDSLVGIRKESPKNDTKSPKIKVHGMTLKLLDPKLLKDSALKEKILEFRQSHPKVSPQAIKTCDKSSLKVTKDDRNVIAREISESLVSTTTVESNQVDKKSNDCQLCDRLRLDVTEQWKIITQLRKRLDNFKKNEESNSQMNKANLKDDAGSLSLVQQLEDMNRIVTEDLRKEKIYTSKMRLNLSNRDKRIKELEDKLEKVFKIFGETEDNAIKLKKQLDLVEKSKTTVSAQNCTSDCAFNTMSNQT